MEREQAMHEIDLENAASGLQERVADSGQFSETVVVNQDGTLEYNTDERNVTTSPLFVILGGESTEALFRTAQEIQSKSPDLNFSFELDPTGQSIKYFVTKNLSEK